MATAWLKKYSEIVQRLLDRREYLGWSQAEASLRITAILRSGGRRRLSKEMLGKIERGDVPLSLDRLLAMAEAYRIHPAFLIDPGQEPAPEEFRPFLQDSMFRRLATEALRHKNRPKIIRIISRHLRLILDEF